MTNTHKYIYTHTHDRTGSSGFIGGRGESADSPLGPMKARKGVSTRMSSENLLDSDRPTVPIRASSMEDIHTLGTQPSRSRSGGIPRIVDSVVKLHLPDHTHKYIDISPVSEGRGGGELKECKEHASRQDMVNCYMYSSSFYSLSSSLLFPLFLSPSHPSPSFSPLPPLSSLSFPSLRQLPLKNSSPGE